LNNVLSWIEFNRESNGLVSDRKHSNHIFLD